MITLPINTTLVGPWFHVVLGSAAHPAFVTAIKTYHTKRGALRCAVDVVYSVEAAEAYTKKCAEATLDLLSSCGYSARMIQVADEGK